MHIVIIGNGITGVTCARFIRKLSDHQITIISAESKYFYSRTALMYIYMGHLTLKHTQPYENGFWKKNRIDLVQAYVSAVNTTGKILQLDNGKTISYDKLVIATGSKSNKFGWKGQDLPGVQGLYNLQDLQLLEENSQNAKHAVIVGGGLIGIELAEMLVTRNIGVTLLAREKLFWDNVLPAEEAQLVSNHIKEHHIDLRLSTELKEVVADDNGRAKAVITNKGDTIPCQIVGLTAGVSPNIGFLEGSGIETARGVSVNHYLETNIPDVYAAGDCAHFKEPLPGRRPIEQVWYTGQRQGATVAYNICGQKQKYNPRLWFNSAKFLDIEYQTYGMVWNKLQEGEDQFYWEHPDGRICLKVVFDKATMQVNGLNTFGFRMRHDVCEQWLLEKRDLAYFMSHLAAANFDPEFYEAHEKSIVAAYNQQFPNAKVQLKSKKSLMGMIFKK